MDQTGTAVQTSGALDPNATPAVANSGTPSTITPPVNTSTPAVNPNLEANVNVGSTINPATLSSSQNTPPILPTTPPPSTADTAVAAANVPPPLANPNTTPNPNTASANYENTLENGDTNAGIPSTSSLNENVMAAQQPVDQTTAEINSLLQEQGFKATDYANMESQYNIPQNVQQIQDLTQTLNQKNAAYQQQFQQIGAQNIPSLFVSGQLALAKQAAAVDIAATSAQIQALNGNVTAAENLVNQAINTKYSGIQSQIDTAKTYLEANQTQLTAAQKIAADRQTAVLAQQKQDVTDQQALDVQAQKDMANQINAGVDAGTAYKAMGDYINGKISLGDFYTQIGLPQGNGSAATNPIVQNTMQMIGLQNDTSVSNAITTVGMQAIINGLVQQEGGTPQGTNNPGNIKFAGQAGATQGTAASDGGNYANFSTPQAFQKAITAMVQKAADSGSQMSDFIASYKGVTNTSGASAPGLTGSPEIDTTAPGYSTTPVSSAGGLTQSAIDQSALQLAMGSLTLPRGTTGRVLLQNTAIRNRAGEIQAGGNIAGNKAQLTALSSSLTQQTQYANTTQRAYNTANQNLGVIQTLMSDNDINESSIPVINQITNAVKSGLTDPGTIAAFNSTLQGLRAEYSQVLAKGGTRSVETDNAASSLIPDDISPAQLQQVATQLGQEGKNAVKEAQNQVTQIQGQINSIISPNTPNTSAFIPKDSNTTASEFVDKTFSSLYPGQTEQSLISKYSGQIPAGEQLVFRNSDGAIMSANPSSDDMTQYTPI